MTASRENHALDLMLYCQMTADGWDTAPFMSILQHEYFIGW